ncbi:MAG: hypothetical protein JWL98_790 [Xanthomonadaceae bacterium]|nr:hypothetical protein [Xanthomonadaceae bacterium]
MSQFEYLSVLVSIIVGLALTQLLSGAARLIQLRGRVQPHATTLCWMVLLFLINTQIWWAAFDRRDSTDWNFFSFLLYLLMPITGFLLSYLVLPELGDSDAIDLSGNFNRNRPWFFGLLTFLPCVSLAEEGLRHGAVTLNGDTGFRVGFALFALVSGRIASERVQRWIALAALLLVCAYVAELFPRLR